MAWPFHRCLFCDGRLSWAVAAHVLALIMVLAQPVASLAWLGGTHATLEQAALHEAAVEQGHYYHHGAPGHHEHQPEYGGKTDSRFSLAMLGPDLTPAAPYAASFQDLLKATLTLSSQASSPDDLPRYASPPEVVPLQHSPPVPHRPPIFVLPTFAIL